MEKGTLVAGAQRSAMGTRGANEGAGAAFPGAAGCWLTAEAGAGVGSASGGVVRSGYYVFPYGFVPGLLGTQPFGLIDVRSDGGRGGCSGRKRPGDPGSGLRWRQSWRGL